MNNKMILAGVCCCLLSGCLANNPNGVGMYGSSNSMNSILNTAMQFGGQNIAQNTGLNVGQQRQLMGAIMSNPAGGQEMTIAQNYNGSTSPYPVEAAAKARQIGNEANMLEIESRKTGLSPDIKAQLETQARDKRMQQKAATQEYYNQRLARHDQASQQLKAKREAAAERERIRRASLTPEQRAAEDKATMNALGTIIGVMGMGAGMDNGGNGNDCFNNPTATGCYDDPVSNSSAPQNNAPAPTSSGFYGNCHGGAAYGC